MIEIALPWPDPRLSPNARVHFMALARVKKSARHDAWLTAIAATTPADALGVDDGWWKVSYAMNGSGRLRAGVLVKVSI
jgi:hypothetical protein